MVTTHINAMIDCRIFISKHRSRFKRTTTKTIFSFVIILYLLTLTSQNENISQLSSSSSSDSGSSNHLEVHTNKPKRCAYENVLSNHTFRRNKQAGVFTHLGHTNDIHQCKELCCKMSDCDVAFMPENHCYAVSCYSDKHCETTPAKSEAFNVQLVKVRRVVIPSPMDSLPEDDEIIRSSLPEVQKKTPTEEEQERTNLEKKIHSTVDDVNHRTKGTTPYEGELLCTHSPISYNMTLKGGVKGGQFTDLGLVIDMDTCISLCCELKFCDLAFMIGERCIATQCENEELCQTIKAKPSKKLPRIAYIRRKEKHLKTRSKPAKPLSQQPVDATQFSEKPAPLLRPSTCQARKIYNNVTLLGGMRAGNYTPLGRAVHLEDCIGRACDLNEGHLALMLGRYCYSVMCNNQRTCQTIPAKPSHLRPKVAYLAWTQEPIEQDTTLMIGDNCYAGDCTSPELCAAVPVPPGSSTRSQIAYITAPGRKKAEDKIANADWSYIYLIVSALVIGVSVLGTAWTICLCALKRHRKKMNRMKKDAFGKYINNVDKKIDCMKGNYLIGQVGEPVGTSSRNESSMGSIEDAIEEANNYRKLKK